MEGWPPVETAGARSGFARATRTTYLARLLAPSSFLWLLASRLLIPCQIPTARAHASVKRVVPISCVDVQVVRRRRRICARRCPAICLTVEGSATGLRLGCVPGSRAHLLEDHWERLGRLLDAGILILVELVLAFARVMPSRSRACGKNDAHKTRYAPRDLGLHAGLNKMGRRTIALLRPSGRECEHHTLAFRD